MIMQTPSEKLERQDENTNSLESSILQEAVQTAIMTWVRTWHKGMGLTYEGVDLGKLMMYELAQRLNAGMVIDG